MIDDNNLAQSLLVNKEDFRKTMETNARFQELMMMYRCAIREMTSLKRKTSAIRLTVSGQE